MRKVFILATLSVIACSKATEEKVYTEEELGVYIDWAYLGWSEVYNDLDGTITLVTTYPDYSDKLEKTYVIEPRDFMKMEIGAFAPGTSISESLTATIKLSDGAEIICTNGADNPWSKHFYETYEQRNEDVILDFDGKKLRHSWLYVTYHIDKTLVDIWLAGQ